MTVLREIKRRRLPLPLSCSYRGCTAVIIGEAVVTGTVPGHAIVLCDPHARRVAQMLAICADGRDPLVLVEIRDTVERAQALVGHACDETPYSHSHVHTMLYQASAGLWAAAAALDCAPAGGE